jgi:hypothetical protein
MRHGMIPSMMMLTDVSVSISKTRMVFPVTWSLSAKISVLCKALMLAVFALPRQILTGTALTLRWIF